MHRSLVVVVALIAVTACNSAPTPATSPSPFASSTAQPVRTPAPTGPPTATPSHSPVASVITEQILGVTVTHPDSWQLVAGPKVTRGRPVPLFYLSNAPLNVAPCPTADPTSGEFRPCPEPLTSLPLGGVLVTVDPNLGILALNPPHVVVRTATNRCHDIGGEAEVSSVVGETVVTACLRGPGLAANEADVRSIIASLAPGP